MRAYELPQITESSPVEEQLRQIKSFLYRQAENLNYNLTNSDVVSLWRQTAEALSVATNDEVEELRRDEYQALRGLIIKSATSIIKNEESFSASFSGDYEARSKYGTFTEEGSIFINGNPYTIGQIYKYQSEIITDVSKYKTELEGYIRTGVLVRDTSKPVFGLEIGYNKNTYTVDGTEYQNSAPAKIRITPLRIGFYQGDYEVAYLENKAIYFPAAHITGGSIKIGDNFSVDNQGNMKALNAVIKGTVHARSGIIGGFETRGASSSEGNFWPCSFSSILTPTDGNPNDDYQYVVFIRGNYTEDGGNYGAIDTTHNVFGIKKRAQTVTSWENDVAPYVYRVTVKGEVTCASLTTDKIDGNYLKINSDNVLLGSNSYKKPIYIYTSDVFQVGSDGYAAAETKVYAAKAYVYAGSTQFLGVIAPTKDTGANLGHLSYKWNHIYSKYLSVSSSECYIGGDSYEAPINIKTSGNLTLGGLVGNTYEEHSFSTIISYMRASRSLISTNTSNLDTTNKNLTDVINQMNSGFATFTNAINNNIVEINKIKAHLGIS